MNNFWHPLQSGDKVYVIAPGSKVKDSNQELDKIASLINSWDLIPIISPEILGDDLLCANTDEARFADLISALTSDAKAIWCYRGGYGCGRLIEKLSQIEKPKQAKLLMGFSDITVLLNYLQQQWGWQTLHSPGARQILLQSIDEDSILLFKNIIFGRQDKVELNEVMPLNNLAKQNKKLTTTMTGGNLTMISTGLKTPWEIDTKNKILLLEDVNEAPYRIDRMLLQIRVSGIINQADAVIFGDFSPSLDTENEKQKMQKVLNRFADECAVPVLQCPGIGHGKTNKTIPFGTSAELNLGLAPSLSIATGAFG